MGLRRKKEKKRRERKGDRREKRLKKGAEPNPNSERKMKIRRHKLKNVLF
jgi:hypothetical protein